MLLQCVQNYTNLWKFKIIANPAHWQIVGLSLELFDTWKTVWKIVCVSDFRERTRFPIGGSACVFVMLTNACHRGKRMLCTQQNEKKHRGGIESGEKKMKRIPLALLPDAVLVMISPPSSRFQAISGFGYPRALQTSFAEPPSGIIMSPVVSSYIISGGMTTFKYALCEAQSGKSHKDKFSEFPWYFYIFFFYILTRKNSFFPVSYAKSF